MNLNPFRKRKQRPFTIRAIETVYQDYRFRSRLEARWAVFFDSCGLKWVYEPEGFQLPSGWYLPDFHVYLNRGRLVQGEWVWAEVKGQPVTTLEHQKAKELAKGTGQRVLLLVGPPTRGRAYECILPSGRSQRFTAFGAQLQAVKAARQARFEHGEQPIIPKNFRRK